MRVLSALTVSQLARPLAVLRVLQVESFRVVTEMNDSDDSAHTDCVTTGRAGFWGADKK